MIENHSAKLDRKYEEDENLPHKSLTRHIAKNGLPDT